MKRTIQIIIKYFFDLLILPVFVIYVLFFKIFFRAKKRRVLMGLMANNNLIYVRNALVNLNYVTKVIPWIIPNHELREIDYDLNIASKYPRLYRNFLGQLLLIYGFFFWALYKFDVFIMPFRNRLLDRTGFLMWFEFQLLHLAGKKAILNPYGGDIQFPEIWYASDDKAFKELYTVWRDDPYYSKISSRKIQKNNKYCTKRADALIVSLDWPDYLEKGNYHYFHMRCIPTIRIASEVTKNKRMFTIVHATNHAHFKGTQHLKNAVSSINENGEICKLIILKKTKNIDVLKAIQNADVVFDQLLLGAYGRLAIEAMSLGKPVICYLREDLKKLYKNWEECPIVNANIDNIKEKILEIMKMPNEALKVIEEKSLSYVKKYHSPNYVGEKLHEIIQEILEK